MHGSHERKVSIGDSQPAEKDPPTPQMNDKAPILPAARCSPRVWPRGHMWSVPMRSGKSL